MVLFCLLSKAKPHSTNNLVPWSALPAITTQTVPDLVLCIQLYCPDQCNYSVHWSTLHRQHPHYQLKIDGKTIRWFFGISRFWMFFKRHLNPSWCTWHGHTDCADQLGGEGGQGGSRVVHVQVWCSCCPKSWVKLNKVSRLLIFKVFGKINWIDLK